MIQSTNIIKSKQHSIPKFKSRRIHIVLLPSNNKTACDQVLPTLRSLGHLRSPHPECREQLVINPCFWMSDCPNTSFIECNGGDVISWWIDDDSRGSSWHVCMHIDVSFPQMVFDYLFILLSVSTRDDKVVLRWDEPIIFLKPEWLSNLVKSSCLRLHLLKLLCSINLRLFDGLISFLLRLLFLHRTLLLNLIVLLHIHLSWQFKINV